MNLSQLMSFVFLGVAVVAGYVFCTPDLRERTTTSLPKISSEQPLSKPEQSLADPMDVPFDSIPDETGERVWDSFTDMHHHYRDKFVSDEFFGARRMPVVDLPSFRRLDLDGQQFQFARVELMTTYKDDEPVVYASSRPWTGGPNRKTYKLGDTRSATDFETSAVEKLRAGRDVIFDGDHDRPHFVAALRATASCIECHDDHAEGDLLGAFAYELRSLQNLKDELQRNPDKLTLIH